jgi:hypothetical protein
MLMLSAMGVCLPRAGWKDVPSCKEKALLVMVRLNAVYCLLE